MPGHPTPSHPPGPLVLAQIKQLGSGDVGMVDLVQLVGTDQRFALKSLEKREMLERNKVGRSTPLPT